MALSTGGHRVLEPIQTNYGPPAAPMANSAKSFDVSTRSRATFICRREFQAETGDRGLH